MRKSKYWFVSEYYWPVENATGYILTKIIDEFSKQNIANVITVGKSSKERNENIKSIRIRELTKLDKNSLFQRLIKLIVTSLLMFYHIVVNVKKNDVVFTVTNPAPIILFSAILKKIKKCKLIYLVHDVFPENLEVTNVLATNNVFYKIAKIIFNKAYSQADCLIVIGRDMKQKMSEKIGSPDKIHVIPNFADIDSIFPTNKRYNELLCELGIENKLILLFTGNIGRMQGIDNLIETIKLLKNDNEIHWLFIGEGACSSKLKHEITINNIQNVLVLPNFPREKSNVFLNAGDVGIVSLVSGINGTGVPSKTYTYMAAGKPILAIMDEDSEIALMVAENGNGWIISPNNKNELRDAILMIKNNTNSLRIMGEISRNICVEKYSENKVTKEFVNKILKIV